MSAFAWRFPKTFELALLVSLIALWTVNLVFEKTSVGKWVAGYNFELYPLSSFSVYLWPKVSGAPLYSFEAVKRPGDKPVPIRAFDMFYPLQAPNLDDEIAFKQLEAIEKSQRNQCNTIRVHYHKVCHKQPTSLFTVPEDVGQMWLRAIRYHTKWPSAPSEIRFVKTYYQFDPKTYQLENTTRHVLMRFYPQQDWSAHVE